MLRAEAWRRKRIPYVDYEKGPRICWKRISLFRKGGTNLTMRKWLGKQSKDFKSLHSMIGIGVISCNAKREGGWGCSRELQKG